MVGVDRERGSRGRLDTILDFLIDAAAAIAGVLIVAVMLFVTVSVLLRYALNRPIGWSVEVCEYSLVCVTFFLAPWVLKKEGHVRVDLAIANFRPVSQALLNTVTSGICAVVCLALTFFAVKVTLELYGGNYFTPTILMIPKFIFIAIIALGLLLLTLQFFRKTRKHLQQWRSLSLEP
jgi:C4-dicarboxylate transporter, DctQ subunit